MLATWLAAAPARGQELPALSEYAVLGLEGVTINNSSRVTSGAIGSVGGIVRVGREARVSVVAAPRIRLAEGARTGNLFCHFVTGPPALPACDGFADPIIDPALLVPPSVDPGNSDFRVPAHTGTSPIGPGNFRHIRVGAGSLLQLAGGDYNARSLRIGPDARVVCTDTCRIGLQQPLRLRSGASLGAESSTRANTVRIDISATGRAAFVASSRTNVSATIFAPGGNILVGRLGSFHGALVGRRVVVAPSATVRGDSAL